MIKDFTFMIFLVLKNINKKKLREMINIGKMSKYN